MRRSRWVSVILGCGLAAGCIRGGHPLAFPGAPIVLISIDTLRADHLPAYGYPHVDTPHIDRFRRDAILWENAYSHCPLTLPSHVSVLTGLLPPEHQVRDNLGYRFDATAHPVFPLILRRAGYAAGAAVSAYVLRGNTGLADAFDFYEDRIEGGTGAEPASEVERAGGETARLLLRWVDGVKDRPFFAFLHIYEPHSPHDPPEPFRSRYPSAYDGEIAAADAIVGGFLDRLREWKVYDRAIIVLLSDHGEGLGDHGEEFHGVLLYREALHVPLLMKLPRSVQAGSRIAAPVGLQDVFPTLSVLAKMATTEGLEGRSLLTTAAQAHVRPGIYAETYYPRIHLGWSELRSLMDDRYHFIEAPRPELYDLTKDPQEKKNLDTTDQAVGSAMRTALMGYGDTYATPGRVAPEEFERLKALGYLAGGDGIPPDDEARGRSTPPINELPDPKERIAILGDVKAAFQLERERKDEDAVLALRKLLKTNPLFFDVRYELGQVLARLGRYAEAFAVYQEATGQSPSPVLDLSLARICLPLGKLAEAEGHARAALGTNPAQAHEVLARVALARDDLPRAEEEVRLAAGDATAELNGALILAEVRIRRGQFPSALDALEAARRRIDQEKRAPLRDLAFLRGDVLARMGRNPEAEAAFQEEVRLFPYHAEAYARLALVNALSGRSVADVNRVLDEMARANPTRDTYLLAAKALESMGDRGRARAWRDRAASAASH